MRKVGTRAGAEEKIVPKCSVAHMKSGFGSSVKKDEPVLLGDLNC